MNFSGWADVFQIPAQQQALDVGSNVATNHPQTLTNYKQTEK